MVQNSLLEFADKINEIIPVIMKEFARRHMKELYKDKLTQPQFFILMCLDKEGESKMTELARFMNVTTSAMTGIIDRLVKYGYVIRLKDPKDRRIIKIKLTVKGDDLVNKINQQRRDMMIKVFGQVSESDREDYLRILGRIREILVKEEALD